MVSTDAHNVAYRRVILAGTERCLLLPCLPGARNLQIRQTGKGKRMKMRMRRQADCIRACSCQLSFSLITQIFCLSYTMATPAKTDALAQTENYCQPGGEGRREGGPLSGAPQTALEARRPGAGGRQFVPVIDTSVADTDKLVAVRAVHSIWTPNNALSFSLLACKRGRGKTD